MITVFGLEPRSVVIAHMLVRLNGNRAVLFDPSKKYFFDSVEDARSADFDRIYSEYREKNGAMDFLEDRKLYEVVSADIFWALRFDLPDNGSLVLRSIDQMASGGSKNYLAEGTAEAREMRSRVKRVLAEFNRALRFVKFVRYEDPLVSMANASFENDICDMVMRAEATRCAEGCAIAVFGGQNVQILHNGIPYNAKRQKVPSSPERKGFKHFWGGLPESGGPVLTKDEMHLLKEMPRIIIPKGQEREVKSAPPLSSTLDDFAL